MTSERDQHGRRSEVPLSESADSVTEWLDAMAAEAGVSREALLDDLLRSYWTLQEVVTLLEHDAALSSPLDGTADRERPSGSAAIDDVRDRMETLASALESLEEAAASDDDLRALAAERTAFEARMEARHAALEDRLESELDDARAVFEHLIDARAATDRRLDELTAALEDVRVRVADRDRADRLRAEARRAGVESATCGGCATAVAVPDLTQPICPACGRELVAVEPARGWLGLGTDRLAVREEARRVTTDDGAVASDPVEPGEPVSDAGSVEPAASDRDAEAGEPVEIDWVLPGADAV